nr:uncharacterized protein LOC128693157 [Cherax quadricarinatus]
MATRCSRILLSFLTSVCLVAAFEIQEDCLVRNTIEVTQIIFDTLEFLSLARPEEHSLTATIFCEDISQFDYLNVTSSSVSLRRLPHDENLNSPTYSTPNTIIGWTRFRLGFMNNLSLYDSNNVSWLPGPTPLDCIISKLKIQNGNFTRQCASNTPAWLMNGSQAVDVLVDADIVSLTSGAKEKRIDLTLFSTKKYKPFFNVCGVEFQLGVREGSLVMVSGLTADPLPPGHHRLALIFLSLDQQTTFKIESEGEQLLETKLASYPSKVRIWGRKNDIFLLVQHLHTIPGKYI